MKPAPADDTALIPELDAPAFLRDKRRRMQAEAPDLGLGYRKSRLDAEIHQRLLDHFRANVGRFCAEEMIEEIGTVDARTIPSLLFEDTDFNARLAADLKPLHEAWAGQPLEVSYCYGIRCYQRGTFLHNHVDRQPHIVSTTICVDHALNAPWPLHIENIDGAVSQINLEPGEFVLYEGTRLAHGRPYPLDGDYYAGVFVHYRPAGQVTDGAGNECASHK
jgi:prolyl 4-hydroxylase